jgi:2-haloacid dehalogenase
MVIPRLEVVLFDVFGTVVDWRTSVVRALTAFGADRGIEADWTTIADEWRGEYQPAMQEVRSGRRGWTILDVLHRESLERVLAHHGIDDLPETDLERLTLVWHRLDPWPDAARGIALLKKRFTVGTLSNGNTDLLADLDRYGGLGWDVLLGAETARAYKPLPDAYLRNVALLGREPDQVMLIAAHNSDLTAASALGLRTGFVLRPTEHGPRQTTDLAAQGDWDVVADDIPGVAAALDVEADRL